MDTRFDPSFSGSARPVRLRAVDAHQVPLARRIGSGLGAELTTDSGTWRLEVSGLRPARTDGRSPPLRLLTRAGPLALAPARELMRTLTAIDLPDDATDDPLQRLRRDVAMQSLPAGWLATFGASAVLSMHGADEDPTGEGSPDDTGQDALELTLSITQPQARLGLAGTLRGSREALLHALSQPAWRPLDAADDLASEDVPLRVPVRLGTASLALSTVQALGPGDVVPLTRALFDLTGEGEMRIGHGVAKVVLRLGNQSAVELTEWHPTTAGQTMNDRLDSPYDTGTDASLDDLPVALNFDIGTLEVTLGELQSLGPGSMLPLSGALPAEVAICAGGRRLGTGELVELDGQLAVEVRRMGAMP